MESGILKFVAVEICTVVGDFLIPSKMFKEDLF
jgi:hypothetical protein